MDLDKLYAELGKLTIQNAELEKAIRENNTRRNQIAEQIYTIQRGTLDNGA